MMELEKKKNKRRGQPSGSVYVIMQEGLIGTNQKGRTTSFTVYGTTPKALKEFFQKKIEEEKNLKR